jgi:hypothetical protein
LCEEDENEKEPEESDIKTIIEYQNRPEGRVKVRILHLTHDNYCCLFVECDDVFLVCR